MMNLNANARRRLLTLPLALSCAVLFMSSARAATSSGDHLIYASLHTAITVPIYQSRVVELPAPVSRVTVGNPDIADVLIFNSAEVYVLGKDLGNTNMLLWDRKGNLVSAITVSVTPDLNALKAMLAKILPGEHIGVTSARRNIVLYGRVSSIVKMDAALQIARSYLEEAATAKKKIMFQQQNPSSSSQQGYTGKVINLMSVAGPQEVMLEVRVAEVQRNAVKQMNLQFLGLDNTGKWVGGVSNGGTTTFPPANWLPERAPVPLEGQPGTSGIAGPNQSIVTPTIPSISTAGLFGSYLSGSFMANAVLDAFRQEGLATILASPTLTTESGHHAQFLSGGSFPIPVPEQNGTIGIQYKDFGVKLGFVPVILSNGRINLKLNVSVSQLTATNSLTVSPITSSSVFAVPAITERSASSTVELANGQTIGIAGLMNDSMQSAVKKFPGLGSIPILGALFRSQAYQDGRTELVILVTPELAKAIPAGQVHLPTDTVTPPSDADFFLLGKMEGPAPRANQRQNHPAAGSQPNGATQSPPPAHP